MANEICLIVLIGLPGCGKTTLAEFLKTDENINYSVCIVTYDDYIKNSDMTEKKYHETRQKLLFSIDNFIKTIYNSTDTLDDVYFTFKLIKKESVNPILIIIDDNNYYRSMRYNFYKLAKKYNISFCQIYLECDLNTCIERNSLRLNNKVPVEIINKMFEKIEVPNEKSHWEKFSIVFKSNEIFESKRDAINILIKDSLSHPVFELPIVENKPVSQNLLHCVDLILRKIVNSEIKTYLALDINNKSNVKKYSSELNSRKDLVLEQIRRRKIFVCEEDLEFILRQLFFFNE